MRREEPISLERLRTLLHYDHETGEFRNKFTRGSLVEGSVAGTTMKAGHIQMVLLRQRYLAHRLAWFYVHGVWPKNEIDHINGKPADNRIANLRDVSKAWNQQNRSKTQERNKTGYTGVSPHGRRFVAAIVVDRKRLHIGVFDTPEEASAAYMEAKKKLHPGYVG